jgi:hypothetical protein
MLEAMIQGKHVGRLDLHVVGDKLSFTDRGERAEIETILADHRRQLTEYDKRLGDTDPATMRDYYEQRRKEIEKAIVRESALLQQIPVAIAGSWFENRIIPLDATTPDQPASRCWSTPTTRRTCGARRPASPSGWARRCPTRPSPPMPGRGSRLDVHRHGGVRRLPRARAGAVEDDQTRARAVRAGARRPRQGPVVRRLPRDRLPADGRPQGHRGRARALRERRVRVMPRAGQQTRRRRRQARHPRPRRPEATCRGCHTADVTNGEFDYKKFVQAIVGPGHLLASRPAGPL